jgi:hypothetical protein
MAEDKEEKKEVKKEEKKEFKSVKDYKLVLQAYNQSVEEIYFWFIGWFKDDFRGQCTIEKLNDVFSAAESSSYFGATQVRLGAQQEKAAGYIRGINEMSKQLFQIVREIRILNERLSYYETSISDDPDAISAEITLKGIYIDLVEGGGKNPSSVYGLAQSPPNGPGFTLLPDLFFRAKVNVHKNESIHRVVYERYKEFNEKVKEVLERKLTQYYTWKMATYKEIKHTREFRLKYLKTYYHTIKMYMQWVRPYLKHIKRLSMDEKRTDTADMIAGMEQAMMEIDLLIHFRKDKDNAKFGDYNSVLHMNFLYRTAPEMSFQERESYQKGPIHVGRVEITFKGYTLTDKELGEFRKNKLDEDFELLGSINETVQLTLESLGDDLKKYLLSEEKGSTEEKKEEEPKLSIFQSAITSLFGKPKAKSSSGIKSTAEVFILPFKGLLDLFDSLTGVSALGAPKEKKKDTWKEDKDKKSAKKELLGKMWLTYNIFKKAHSMITW